MILRRTSRRTKWDSTYEGLTVYDTKNAQNSCLTITEDRLLHSMDPTYFKLIYQFLYLPWYFMFYLKLLLITLHFFMLLPLSCFLFSYLVPIYPLRFRTVVISFRKLYLNSQEWVRHLSLCPCSTLCISLFCIPGLLFSFPNSLSDISILSHYSSQSQQWPPYCQIWYFSVFIFLLSSMDTADHSFLEMLFFCLTWISPLLAFFPSLWL